MSYVLMQKDPGRLGGLCGLADHWMIQGWGRRDWMSCYPYSREDSIGDSVLWMDAAVHGTCYFNSSGLQISFPTLPALSWGFPFLTGVSWEYLDRRILCAFGTVPDESHSQVQKSDTRSLGLAWWRCFLPRQDHQQTSAWVLSASLLLVVTKPLFLPKETTRAQSSYLTTGVGIKPN